MKYIIDIPNGVEWGVVTCRTEDGFYTRDFDSLEELTSDYINEHYGSLQEDAYQRGLEDAWEAAKKLFSSMADSDIEKAFPIEWNNGGFKALMNLQPQEAIEKLKAYEEKQKADDEIKVGDEVRGINGNEKLVITAIESKYDHCVVMTKRGGYFTANLSSLVKTGRHFDISSILKEMQS